MPARTPLALLLGQALTGLLLGVGWWWLTRDPADVLLGEPVRVSPSALPMARDGVLTVLTAVAGIVFGALATRRSLRAGADPAARGTRPSAMLVALLCGAGAGALLAAATGSALPASSTSPFAEVGVGAVGVLLVWPLAASLTVFVLTAAGALRDWVRDGAHPGEERPPTPG